MRSEVRFAEYREYTKKRTEASNALKARGLARFSYRPLDLTDDELKEAIERARWNCE